MESRIHPLRRARVNRDARRRILHDGSRAFMNVRSIPHLVLVCILGALASAEGRERVQPSIVNPSFEAGNGSDAGGYVAIQGWTADAFIGTGYGINEGGGAFADNGAVPHGSRVAFLQNNGGLFQKISGFVAGEKYWLVFRENARGLCCGHRVAILKVLIEGTMVVPEHEVAMAGQSNPYRLVISEAFVATGLDMKLLFSKGGYGDSAVLLDDVRILGRESLPLAAGLRPEKISAVRAENLPGRLVTFEYIVTPTPDTSWETILKMTSRPAL
jgi:hypothetical protein